jgi:hypothetical protein
VRLQVLVLVLESVPVRVQVPVQPEPVLPMYMLAQIRPLLPLLQPHTGFRLPLSKTSSYFHPPRFYIL